MSLSVKSKVEVPELIEKRRGQITQAALELFGKRGYHSTTIRDVAKRAGVSIGTIYQYVSDKEDVLYLVLVEVLDGYKRRIPAALAGLSDPLVRFRGAVRGYCAVNDEKAAATVLAYRETSSLRKERRDAIKQLETETNELIAACIKDCVEAGYFERDIDVELLTYHVVMMSHAWALKAWRFRGLMSLDAYVARGLRLMLGGILTARGKSAYADLGK